MSQNDFNLANQGFPAMRADMNSAFQALASNSSGATEPGTTYAYQWWYDTDNDILKMRNSDDDAWINIAAFDQANDTWSPYIGSAQLTATADEINILDGVTATTAELNILDGVTSSSTELNLLDGALDHDTATWEAGTATEPGVPSPADVKAAIDALTSGVLLKRHRVESFIEVSLSAAIPGDATAPQDNEGLEVLTYDYTPEASDSTIRVTFFATNIISGNGTMAAIFAAGSTDAIATGATIPNAGASAGAQLLAECEFASTGTSSRKISVRLGQLFGGTATINDASYSGKYLMSMTIEEYAA